MDSPYIDTTTTTGLNQNSSGFDLNLGSIPSSAITNFHLKFWISNEISNGNRSSSEDYRTKYKLAIRFSYLRVIRHRCNQRQKLDLSLKN